MQPPTDSTIPQLLDGLNPPQREAVVHTDGPLLILAGPGSGKTRVVTRRAAHLAATVTAPHHILAITFTNKAAAEMRERIEALGVARGMTVCTFHALCAKLLRIHADRADLTRNFTILDRDDRDTCLGPQNARRDTRLPLPRTTAFEAHWLYAPDVARSRTRELTWTPRESSPKSDRTCIACPFTRRTLIFNSTTFSSLTMSPCCTTQGCRGCSRSCETR